MSTAVYAVHAAQWAARQGATSAPRREFFSQLRLKLRNARKVEMPFPAETSGWNVVYGTMLRQWEEEQARLLAKTWRGRVQAMRETFSEIRPLMVSTASGLMVLTVSDVMVQKAVEKRKEIDVTRTTAMGLFGLGYAGFLQHFLYTRLWPLILQAARLSGSRAVAFQVLGDQGVYMPLMYLPIYYASKEMACAGQMIWETAMAGVQRCRENLMTDLQLCCCYWIPVQAVTFGLVPLAARVFFMSMAGVVFQVGLQTVMLQRRSE